MGTAAAAAAAAAGASPPSPLITAKSPPDAVAALAAGLVPSWSGLPPSSLEVRVISGGITNALWSVAVKPSVLGDGEPSPRAVAVRAYGDRTDLLIDRALEVETLVRLNAAGFGARVLAGFEGGRVEEFLPGRALTPEETARSGTAERVARGLARLHAVGDLGARREKRRETERAAGRLSSLCPPSGCLSFFFSPRPRRSIPYSEKDSALFPTIREWIALADRLDAEGGAGAGAGAGGKEAAPKTDTTTTTTPTPPPPPPPPSSSSSPSVGSAELLAEVALLEERVRASCRSCRSPPFPKNAGACPELSRVVFCHMDLLPGNIMTTDDLEEEQEKTGSAEIPSSSSVEAAAEAAAGGGGDEPPPPPGGGGGGPQFIDFEYGRPCPAGFDVGNHWCEYAGLDCDWSRYPTREQRRAFARAYLSEADRCSPSRRTRAYPPGSLAPPPPPPPPPPPSDERVAAFVEQAELFSLAAHLFWTAWARVQVHVSPIDFDYGGYARSRFEDYGRRKGAVAAFAR